MNPIKKMLLWGLCKTSKHFHWSQVKYQQITLQNSLQHVRSRGYAISMGKAQKRLRNTQKYQKIVSKCSWKKGTDLCTHQILCTHQSVTRQLCKGNSHLDYGTNNQNGSTRVLISQWVSVHLGTSVKDTSMIDRLSGSRGFILFWRIDYLYK